MRPFYFLLLVLGFVSPSVARAQSTTFPAFGGMSLLSRWQDPDSTVFYNDIWGYVAPDGREYAIVGSSYGTNFVDVTTPTAPRLVARIAGRQDHSTWRDFKTYGHYAYGVADVGAHSLQIFDLSGLPNAVRLVYDSDSLCQSAHTCFIENDRLYLTSTIHGDSVGGRRFSDVAILSLANPERPTFVHGFNANGGHASFVRRDTLYLSAEYDGFKIFDVRNPLNPVALTHLSQYPGSGYNHTSWTTTNGRLLVMADEVPQGLPLKLVDLTNVRQPQVITTFNSHPFATPHNPFIVQDRYVVTSAYVDGVQVFDISNPSNPVHIGGFDTRPENDSTAGSYHVFAGCWGVYPFFPSGTIVASDIQRGLFVIQPPYRVTGLAADAPRPHLSVWPNPAHDALNLSFDQAAPGLTVVLFDALGRLVPRPVAAWEASGRAARFSLAGLAPGAYWLRVGGPGAAGTPMTRVVVE